MRFALLLLLPLLCAVASRAQTVPPLVPSLDRAGEHGAAHRGLAARGPLGDAARLTALPGARAISNALMAAGSAGSDPEEANALDPRGLSEFSIVFHQFTAHQLVLTGAEPGQSLPMAVPLGDPVFDRLQRGDATLPFTRTRSVLEPSARDGSQPVPLNGLSSYLDGSSIYGTSLPRLAALRTGRGGLLRLDEREMLPLVGDLPAEHRAGFAVDADAGANPMRLFAAGDVRASEHAELSALHTVWAREHNAQARAAAAARPGDGDEALFVRARQMVLAELQRITFYEALPALIGQRNMPPAYRGYRRPAADAVGSRLSNDFATAAYRFGHSMISPHTALQLREDGTVTEGAPLRTLFFNTTHLLAAEQGVDGLLRGMMARGARAANRFVAEDLRSMLFQHGPQADPSAPGASNPSGHDLAARNLQRGRDHRLVPYNAMRIRYGLPPMPTFVALLGAARSRAQPQVVAELRRFYGSPDECDAWLCGRLEAAAPDSSLGPLFTMIISDQFARLRDHDPHWYEALGPAGTGGDGGDPPALRSDPEQFRGAHRPRDGSAGGGVFSAHDMRYLRGRTMRALLLDNTHMHPGNLPADYDPFYTPGQHAASCEHSEHYRSPRSSAENVLLLAGAGALMLLLWAIWLLTRPPAGVYAYGGAGAKRATA